MHLAFRKILALGGALLWGLIEFVALNRFRRSGR